jgi:tetratricopeptide (TPR) repeat protein
VARRPAAASRPRRSPPDTVGRRLDDARITSDFQRMSWWSRLLGGRSDSELKPQRVDYLNEALALERQGEYDAALTSYRLALRDKPYDAKVLQNMAIAYTRLNRLDEAIRCYRRALEVQPSLSGAHYGLAYLLLKRGDRTGAESHLDTFLASPPSGQDADGFVMHARETLASLRAPRDAESSLPNAAEPSAESPAGET